MVEEERGNPMDSPDCGPNCYSVLVVVKVILPFAVFAFICKAYTDTDEYPGLVLLHMPYFFLDVVFSSIHCMPVEARTSRPITTMFVVVICFRVGIMVLTCLFMIIPTYIAAVITCSILDCILCILLRRNYTTKFEEQKISIRHSLQQMFDFESDIEETVATIQKGEFVKLEFAPEKVSHGGIPGIVEGVTVDGGACLSQKRLQYYIVLAEYKNISNEHMDSQTECISLHGQNCLLKKRFMNYDKSDDLKKSARTQKDKQICIDIATSMKEPTGSKSFDGVAYVTLEEFRAVSGKTKAMRNREMELREENTRLLDEIENMADTSKKAVESTKEVEVLRPSHIEDVD